jgi:hypothetical protein
MPQRERRHLRPYQLSSNQAMVLISKVYLEHGSFLSSPGSEQMMTAQGRGGREPRTSRSISYPTHSGFDVEGLRQCR